MELVHVCLIGAGKHASANIIPSLREITGISVDAVCTRHLENAQKAVSSLNTAGNAYNSIDAMLAAEDCRNILIVMQAEDAFEAVKKCIRARRRVFCEKPLGMNTEQAREIQSLAEEYQVSVMTGFMKEYAPAYRMIKEAICDKTYGNACSYHGTMNVDASAFCKTDREFMYYVGIHFIALLRFLFGKPTEIQCISSTGSGGSDYHILFRHPGGVTGSLQLENRSAWTREYEELTVTFENGYATAADLHTVRFHGSEDHSGTGLSEKMSVFIPSETPGLGASRDLLLRGFIGELSQFTAGTDADPHENTEVAEILDAVLDQISEYFGEKKP